MTREPCHAPPVDPWEGITRNTCESDDSRTGFSSRFLAPDRQESQTQARRIDGQKRPDLQFVPHPMQPLDDDLTYCFGADVVHASRL